MSKKIVIRADIICKKSTSEILTTVAKLKGIKSMDIDHDKNTLTVVGTVDPVRMVQQLRKGCFAATIVSVEDDKPKETKTPCQEACEKSCKEKCEKLCKDCEKACKDKCEKACKDPPCCEKACKEACCEKEPWYGYDYSYGYGYGVPARPLEYGCSYGRPFYL